jgi:putative oxidoreductase
VSAAPLFKTKKHMNNSNQQQSKAMNIALWVVQVILAAFFLMAGFPKVTTPVEQLAAGMPWVNDVPFFLVQFIGVAEVLAALGLILPSALRIKPRLTIVAAGGVALLMVFGFVFHASRGEYQAFPVNTILGGLALFIVWGRSKKAVILSRDELV